MAAQFLAPGPSHLRRLPPLPSLCLRNIELERRLDTLLQIQPILTIVAPAGAGKSTAIASWLRNSSINRYPTWIESTLDPADRVDVVARVRETALTLCGENAPHIEWGTAPHRRAAAQLLGKHMKSDAIFVVRRAPHSPSQEVRGLQEAQQEHEANATNDANDADRELFELIVECERLSLVIIETEPDPATTDAPGETWGRAVKETTRATIGLQDLALSGTALRREASRLAVQLPEPVASLIMEQFDGSPRIAAACFEAVLQYPTAPSARALQQAHSEVLMDAALEILGPLAAPTLALMAVIESATSELLGRTVTTGRQNKVSLANDSSTTSATDESAMDVNAATDQIAPLNQAQFTAALESLARASLITVIRVESKPALFCLSPDVREQIRARTITQYLDNRVLFHIAASDAHRSSGNVVEALRHLLLVDRTDAALALFCSRWDAPQTEHERGQLCDVFPRDVILSSLEAVAICWLVRSRQSRHDEEATVRFSTRLSETRISDIGILELRARVTVRAAMIRALLEENRLEEAASTAADAASDLQRASAPSRRALRGAYTEHLLSAAKCALVHGDLLTAHLLFTDAATAARGLADGHAQSSAYLGLALCNVFNANFNLAQQYIDDAGISPDSDGENAVAEAWAQIMLWGSVGAFVRLGMLGKTLTARARSDVRWRALAQFVDVSQFAAVQDFPGAMNALRNLAGLSLGGQQQPLFQQTVHALLAFMSMLSNRPATGFTALTLDIPSQNHAVCFNVFRSFLESVRGDPAAALRATDPCLALAASHAKMMLPWMYLSRAVAFDLLSRKDAAADAFEVAVGLATTSSQKIPFEEIRAQFAGRADASADVPGPPDDAGSAALTRKEREVLAHLGRDETLSTIATGLFVSENTLKSHTRSIYRKLGVSSRREATDRGALWGLI